MKVIDAGGLRVSDLCLGGNVFGWSVDRDESFAVLDAFIDAGGTFIDTADMYSQWKPGNVGGESERIIGQWIASRGVRDQVVIATKVAKSSSRPGLSAANIAAAADESLSRLGIDTIDLYYAHEDDQTVDQVDTMTAFSALVTAGKVRTIGASNFTAERIASALAICAATGLTAFSAVQPEFNVIARSDYEGDLADLCVTRGLACHPYYALARGLLTGKHTRQRLADSVRAEDIAEVATDHAWDIVDIVRSVADKHHTSMAAVALAWLRAQPGVASPIASVRTPAQLADLLAPVTLDRGDLDLLTAG